MNPIDPVASFKRRATSLYGMGGCSKNSSSIISRQRGGSWRDGVAHHLFPFDIGQHVGRDRVQVAEILDLILTQFAPLMDLAALPVITLVRGDADQPSLQGFGIAQPGKFVEKIQADGLEDVRRILGGCAIAQGNRVNQVLVAIQQCTPCAFIASQAFRDHASIAPFGGL